LILVGICVIEVAGKHQASQLSVRRTERKRTERAKSQLGEPLDHKRKTRLAVDERNHYGLLILVHPPCDRFFLRNTSDGECLNCTVIRLEEMPMDPIGRGIQLADAIKWNHLMQFVSERLE
jgi:hypothetical protein